ncbi:MAG: LysE family transporter [Ornithinimicrobium sp.]
MPLALILTGLLTGWALLIAIGAQNTFVLRQGLRAEHVGKVVAFCAVSDLILIGVSVLGVGLVLAQWPSIMPILRVAGGLFMIAYGAHAAYRVGRPTSLVTGTTTSSSARHTLSILAVLTWLNPHLYLDMMMMGTFANSHGPQDRWWFFAGLYAASLSWFLALGYGATRLRPLLSTPRSWQIFDSAVALMLIALGASLILGG